MDLLRDNNGGNSWEFVAARLFLQYYTALPSDVTPAAPTLLNPDSYKAFNLKSRSPGGLGDFERLFNYCGKPLDISQRQSTDSSSSARYEDSSSPASSAPDDEITHFDDFVAKGKEVRWTDIEGTAELAEVRRRSTRSSRTEVLDGLDSDTEDAKSIASRRSVYTAKEKKKNPPSTLSALVPDPVPRRDHGSTPNPACIVDPEDLAERFVNQTVIKACYPLSANEQKINLIKKLAALFHNEATLLKSLDMLSLISRSSNMRSSGIHVSKKIGVINFS
jgi:hypothetical protein